MNDKTTFEASKTLAELGLSQELLIRHEYWQKATKKKYYLDDITYNSDSYCTFIENDYDGYDYFDEKSSNAKQKYYRAYSFFELWKMLPEEIFDGAVTIDFDMTKLWAGYGIVADVSFSDYPTEADALAQLIKELVENGYMEV